MAGQNYLQPSSTGVGLTEKKSITLQADTPVAGDLVALQDRGDGTMVVHRDLLNTVSSSAGAADTNKLPILDASGRLDITFLPAGIAEAQSMVTGEALSAGDWINVYDDAGAFKVRKADNSATGKPVDGFVLAAAASGANVTVYFEGVNDQVTGMTAGPVWASTTVPGGSTQTLPSGTGKVRQSVGTALSATSVQFEKHPPILLA